MTVGVLEGRTWFAASRAAEEARVEADALGDGETAFAVPGVASA